MYNNPNCDITTPYWDITTPYSHYIVNIDVHTDWSNLIVAWHHASHNALHMILLTLILLALILFGFPMDLVCFFNGIYGFLNAQSNHFAMHINTFNMYTDAHTHAHVSAIIGRLRDACIQTCIHMASHNICVCIRSHKIRRCNIRILTNPLCLIK